MKINKLIDNLALHRKFSLILMMANVTPLLILLLLSVFFVKNVLIKQELSLLEDSLQQSISYVKYKADTYNNVSDIIATDTEFLVSLNQPYDDNYFEMYQTQTNVISPIFTSCKLLNLDMESIGVYTDCGLTRYKDIIYPMEELTAQPWYERIAQDFTTSWIISGKDVFCVRRLLRTQRFQNQNYLCMKVNYGSFFSSFADIDASKYGIVLLDEENNMIYHNDYLKDITSLDFSDKPQDQALITHDKTHYVCIREKLPLQGWEVFMYVPLTTLFISINDSIFLSVVIILLSMGIIIYCSSRLASSIIHPLEQLTKSTQDVIGGNLDTHINADRTDEIGILVQSFNEMVKRLKHLIEEVYQNQIEIKQYQLKVLRAQINPHFLYNTLGLINGKAITAGQTEISHMTLLLSKFYRTSLNHGKDMTEIYNEIENIKTYISLQQIMYDHGFEVVYQLDERLFDCTMPNLVLQPIVENAIEHGLQNSETREKELRISLLQKANDIIFTITDNGQGIPLERMETVLMEDSKNVGLKNVDARLKLSYGMSYGLTMESDYGYGTTVTVKIPYRIK